MLLHLGGGELASEIQLEEIHRISSNISALIDSEKAAPDAPLDTKRVDFVEKCRQAGVHCHILDYRAIEYYLSDRAVKLIKGENYTALSPYESLKKHSNGWAKSDNWRIARVMTLTELEGTDLGNFLSSL